MGGKGFYLFNFDFLVLPVNIWLVDIGPVEEEEPDNYLVVVQDSLQARIYLINLL